MARRALIPPIPRTCYRGPGGMSARRIGREMGCLRLWASPPRRRPASRPRRGGLGVDGALRQLRELLVRGLLLLERLLQQAGHVLFAQALREGPGTAVAGHLVVLDALGRGDQGGVLDVRVAAGANRLLALADEPLHGLAGLRLRRLA